MGQSNDDLMNDGHLMQSPEPADQKAKRAQDDAIQKSVPPQPDSNVGTDTTGVGQPGKQAVNQGGSLPQSAIPIEKKFEGTGGGTQYYNPAKEDAAEVQKNLTNSGAQKTDI